MHCLGLLERVQRVDAWLLVFGRGTHRLLFVERR
jgi:hypothetical protein